MKHDDIVSARKAKQAGRTALTPRALGCHTAAMFMRANIVLLCTRARLLWRRDERGAARPLN
jgi:hypothetical protein